jgi:gamma-glutamyl-gamma-aminobutyrate hydrolase PuuD
MFFGKIVKVVRKIKPLVYSSHHQAIKDVGTGILRYCSFR